MPRGLEREREKRQQTLYGLLMYEIIRIDSIKVGLHLEGRPDRIDAGQVELNYAEFVLKCVGGRRTDNGQHTKMLFDAQ